MQYYLFCICTFVYLIFFIYVIFYNNPNTQHELRMELHSTDRNIKVDAVKKVIASMTVGKDVSSLFTDVLNCVQTGNIELKKLVYLYLINYAKSQPELTLLAVNTFVKDANDPNPLIRALAVRTMGCIRVDRITEYLCEPLGRALRDDDPVSLMVDNKIYSHLNSPFKLLISISFN